MKQRQAVGEITIAYLLYAICHAKYKPVFMLYLQESVYNYFEDKLSKSTGPALA